MTEYYFIRIALAIVLIWMGRRELPPELHRYVVFMAIYQSLPQFLWSREWSQSIWIALSASQMFLSFLVTRELFEGATLGRTHWYERSGVVVSAALVGIAFILISWRWNPENPVQTWTLIQQYCRIGLLFAWLTACARFYILRPLSPHGTDALAMFWTIWISAQAVMATAGSAGILWNFVPQSMAAYRIVGDFGMIIQIAAAIGCGIRLRRSSWTHATI